MDDVQEALKRVDLFAGLEDDALGRMAAVMERVELADGRLVFAEGDAGDALYVVLSGGVRIGKGKGFAPGQYRRFLATLGPGDFFGELALILDEPRNAAAIAQGATVLLRLPREAFDRLLNERDALAFDIACNLARALALRLRKISDGLTGAEQRAATSSGPSDIADLRASLFSRGFVT